MTPKIASIKTILGGKPHIYGTRISVGTIVSYLINGYSYDDIKNDYPSLTDTQIDAARDYLSTHPQEFNLEPQKT